MEVTAVVLSENPYTRSFDGIEVLVHQEKFSLTSQFQKARFEAVKNVSTEWFFFLDDDDDLPSDYLDVLAKCLKEAKLRGSMLVYTDEIRRTTGLPDELVKGQEYSQRAFLSKRLLVHHLVLMNTKLAQAVVQTLPLGDYAPDFMLSWEMAKYGALYVPEAGYIWNVRPGSMHTRMELIVAFRNTISWCYNHPHKRFRYANLLP